MNWINNQSYIEILPPVEFNFKECLVFLNRCEEEILHKIREGYLYKLIKVEQELILCKIGCIQNVIRVEFPMNNPTKKACEEIAAYIWEWFDLDKDLSGFYEMATQDKVLQGFVHKYYGSRIMCIPDFFEALSWAIMGQQINLTFAYKLKKRFVEHFGECVAFEGDTFWSFPTFDKIAAIEVEILRELQFTVRKAEYIIEVARQIKNGKLTKEALLQEKDYEKVKKILIKQKGVGPWTADYVMMKCLHHPSAFPIMDVGIHNALKLQLGRSCKPTVEEIEEISSNWMEWKAYSAFYLWRSLYEAAI